MSDNDLYLLLADEVCSKIEEQNPKSKDEAMAIVNRVRNRILDKVDNTLDEIGFDYCDEKGLEWEEDE